MKRGVVFFILILFIVFFLNFNFINNTLKELTGSATAIIDFSIRVQAVPAILTLYSPYNHTYFNNYSMLLNYTVSGEQAVWYKLDNNANSTITSFIYFNVSDGVHNLILYANNTDNNLSYQKASFIVNTSKFTVYYEEYDTSYKGSTTDFNRYSFNEIQSLEDVVLENTNYGKISFNQAINLSSNSLGNELNLSQYVNISNNRIELNSTVLTGFNVLSTLTLLNLSFSNPRILRNGEVCSSSICTQQSYSGGNLIFNVTGFSIYSAEEIPVAGGDTGGSGGSGRGSSRAIQSLETISINKDQIKLSLKQGENKQEMITITNKYSKKINVLVSAEKIEEFVKIDEPSFELDSGETKTIILDFLAREDAVTDLHIGKIIVSAESIKKEILTAIEVESKKSLFDVNLEINEHFSEVAPEEELLLQVKIFNIKRTGRAVDVEVEYQIIDLEENIIVKESETIAVEFQTSFVKEFKIPASIKGGKYIIYVKTTYENEVASASAFFSVKNKLIVTNERFFIFIISLLIILILIVLIEIRNIKKYVKHGKVGEKELKKSGFIK